MKTHLGWNGMAGRSLAIWAVAALAATGCGGGAPSAQPPSSAPSAATSARPAVPVAATPPILPQEPDAGPTLLPITYESKGRRDPFVPVAVHVEQEKAGVSVATMKLNGIVRGRVPLALVEGPDGVGYILKPGDVLADGRVVEITPNSVSFAVAPRAGQTATTVTLKLPVD